MSPERQNDQLSTFSLTEGGPFYRLLSRWRIVTPESAARCWWLALGLWLPLALGEGVRTLLGLPLDPMLYDLSIHVRILFTLPVLLVAERLLEQCSRSTISSLVRGGYYEPGSIDRILARAERMRDSRAVELFLLGLAWLNGQLVLWEVFGSAGWIHGGTEVGEWSFARLWYTIVALPIVQLVLFRWLWRWGIWSYVTIRLSRLTPSLLMTHADRAGGLSALARPVTAFCGLMLAISAILSGAWGTQLLSDRATLEDLIPIVTELSLVALALGLGPLLFCSGHLSRARRRDLTRYADFTRDYVRRFHAKWIEGDPVDPLGTPDVQSLRDLDEVFVIIHRSRIVAFGPRTALNIVLSVILPMVPLVATSVTAKQVFSRILAWVLAGFPI